MIEYRSSVVGGVDVAGRTIDVIAMPYGERAVIEHRGRVLSEIVERGAFSGLNVDAEPVPANREHDRQATFGRVIGANPDDPRGLVVSIRAAKTARGDETLQLASEGVLRASVGMFVPEGGDTIRDGLRRVTRALLDHVALVESPAYRGAVVVGVRSSGDDRIETPNLDRMRADPIIGPVLSRRGARTRRHG